MSLLVAGLCDNARRHPEFGYVGDQTETALLEFAERTGAPLEQHKRTGTRGPAKSRSRPSAG